MFGIGLPELILIMGVALIVVGPEKLPDLAKSMARIMLDLKKTVSDFKENLDEELKEDLGSAPSLAAPDAVSAQASGQEKEMEPLVAQNEDGAIKDREKALVV